MGESSRTPVWVYMSASACPCLLVCLAACVRL